jgi:Flp pilus assembly pilin Flp
MNAHIRPQRQDTSKGRRADLAADARGTSMVEFGLLLPVLSLMLIGSVDLAQGIGAKLALEQAVHRTMEMASVGVVGSNYQHLRTEAAAAAIVPLANVTLEQWAECDGTKQASFDAECGSNQMVARYVKISVRKDHKPSFKYGPLGKTFAVKSDGSIELTAHSSLRVQ